MKEVECEERRRGETEQGRVAVACRLPLVTWCLQPQTPPSSLCSLNILSMADFGTFWGPLPSCFRLAVRQVEKLL